MTPTPERVKALEWERGAVDWAEPMPGMKYVACATTPAGTWAWWLGGEKGAGSVCQSEEAAKAAAQADYERRVRACLEPGQGWRSMDSAPRDGTEILVYFPLDGLNTNWARRVPVIWGGKEWVHTGRSGGYSHAYQPTHWQPLPPPPAAEGQE